MNLDNRHKAADPAQFSSELQNLLVSTDIDTLLLDQSMRVHRFTPRVADLFNMTSSDRGRPLSEMSHSLVYPELIADCAEVLNTFVPIEREVHDQKDNWYMTRVLPYRNSDDRIEGVVLTFVDITRRKRTERALERSKEYAESIVQTLHEPLIVLRPNLTVHAANSAFYEAFRVDRSQTLGRQIYELGNGQWDIPALRALLETVLPASKVVDDFEVTHDFPFIGRRTMLVNARRLDHAELILLSLRDTTESKRRQQELLELNETLEARVAQRTRQVRALASTLTMAEHRERRRIAQILHDDLQQRLYGMQIRTTFIREAATGGDTAALLPQVDQLDRWLVDAIHITRQLARDLSPPVLRNEGLREAMSWLASQMKQMYDLDVLVRVADDSPLGEGMMVLTTQVTREMLFNIVKHARTSSATVATHREDSTLVIQISDKGIGFDPTAVSRSSRPASATGLFNVYERLGLFGGRIDIDSAPGKGTRVTIRLPVDATAADRAF